MNTILTDCANCHYQLNGKCIAAQTCIGKTMSFSYDGTVFVHPILINGSSMQITEELKIDLEE